ncbi:hypothetical protein [Kribbella sp. NPDC049227]|uniref:hypothetical protein n=1 Tax=Kribbella sp. NPDC049227 TaxID=3364113 RepID=UPI0037238ABA
MTDLKELLDRAAGAEPGVSDADLSADLDRGRRALRRRRATGIASGAVATALIVGVGWSVLPTGTATDGAPEPAGPTTAATPTPAPMPSRSPGQVIGGLPGDHRPPAPVPSTPVPLVATAKAFPGPITCDLIPQGWAVKLVGTKQNGDPSQQDLTDPNLRNPEQYHAESRYLRIRASQLMDQGEGLTADKYSTPWTDLPKVRAGKNEAVITPGNTRNGRRELFVRQGRSTRVVVLSNSAYNLGWDQATLLKFAGSCHYKK